MTKKGDLNAAFLMFGYLDFGHWDLFEICYLKFVIYTFR